MFKYLNKRRQNGQSTLEYAILIIIIIGALLSIQMYIKRGIQGRLKSATDDIGVQFSPDNVDSVHTTVVTSSSNDTFQDGVTSSILTADEITTETLNSDIVDVEREFWGQVPPVPAP